ncbi:MAG: tetratricopeptide repeat protein [Myxococcales bacterium]|nr:tetratricopeptide repeat protein [Myxococcales bacterium]
MKKSSSLVLLSVALTLAVPFAPIVHAEPSKSELDAARKKFEKALELEKDGDWKGALALLKEVEKVKVSSQVLFHIALCHEKLGKLVLAIGIYKRAKEEAETKEGKEGATMVKKCDERIADLEVRTPWVEVKVKDDVVSAKCSIDGAEPFSVIVAPSFRVDPGDHELVVTSPGRKTWKKKITLKEKDEKLVLKAKLPREDDNDAETDGDPVGETPAPTPVKKPVVVDTAPPAKKPVWAFVAGGVGVAALGTAGIMYALRGSVISDLDAACNSARTNCPPDKRSLEDTGKTYTTAGNVLLGVGLVAVTTGVVLYFVRPGEKSVGVTSLGVGVGPTPAGASVVGAF